MLRRLHAVSRRLTRQSLLARSARRRHRRLGHLEHLEGRVLLASDLGVPPLSVAEFAGPAGAPLVSSVAEGEAQPEGEDARDLVAFAKALTAAGVKFFGADWCRFCNEQKIVFQDGARFLPFIEVTNPDRTLNAIGQAENITVFPTWKFPNGTQATGNLSLEELSQRSGVAIPTGSNPSFAPLQNTTVKIGSPLHLPIDGYDPNGGPLTITAVSSNPAVVTATVKQTNPSLRMNIVDKNNNQIGDMVFQLFQDLVPRAAGRMIQLAQSGFYNLATHANPVTFHRVIRDFVIQGGDPTGSGAGGSSLGQFDDQYHVDLQHNQSGVLSYAKSSDDTNDSQFFVTAGPKSDPVQGDIDQRNLDFNHSVIGQLIEGDDVRKTIERTPTDGNDRPTNAIRINSATIFQDVENGLVMLKATGAAGQQADVTITITDQDGNSFSQTIRVTVAEDTKLTRVNGALTPVNVNSAPFLRDIPQVVTTVNTPVTIHLQAVDVENDPLFFDAVVTGTTQFTHTVNNSTGAVTVTPPVGFIGTLQLLVGVRGATPATTVDQFDTQRVTIQVLPTAPTVIDLEAASDNGTRNDDNITSAGTVQVRVDGVTAGAVVSLLKGNTVVKDAVAAGNSVTMSVDLAALGDGVHELRAVQRINNETSAASPSLSITLDRSAPQFTNALGTAGRVAVPYSHNVNTTEEATGVQYSLVTAPTGMTIDEFSGLISWTPAPTQRGDQNVTVRVSDAAGNTSQQQATITVGGSELVRYRVEATRPAGQAATVFEVGDIVTVNVYVQDLRTQPQGLESAFVDLLFPGQQLTTVGNLQYGSIFTQSQSGTPQAAQLEEVGAATDGAVRDGSEQLLFSFQFRAQAPGNALLQLDPADVLPSHATRLVGFDPDVAATEILFGSQLIGIFLPFTVQNELINVNEDAVEFVDVLANDFFHGTVTGPLRVKSLGTPSAGGAVTIHTDGRVRYVPKANFFGTETFTYVVTDDVTGDAQGTVTVQVHPQNDPPTLQNDSFTGSNAVNEDAAPTILDVLANDSSVPDANEVLRVVAVGTTSNGGTVTIGPSGTHIVYKPAVNFFGTETFTYTVSDRQDNSGQTATATVTVEVKEVNDPPVVLNDSFTLAEDSLATRFDPLANDHSGPDPQENLTIQTVAPQANARGTVTIVENGKAVHYTPPADFFGQDLFVYTISDGRGGTAQGVLRFTVTAVNDPPSAVPDTGANRFKVSKNTSNNAIDVLRNDTSAPDAPEVLLVKSVTPVSGGGTLRVSDDRKTVLLTPAANFVGLVTFQYTIEDPEGATATATAEVEVLDFQPSLLSGFVYIDANHNGQYDTNEQPLAGVLVSLSGVDRTGAAVQLTQRTAADGSYEFKNLVPGTYALRQTQPSFMVDGRDTIGTQGGVTVNDEFRITLGENINGVRNNFGERGAAPRFTGVHDLFASTARQSVLLIVNQNTGQTVAATPDSWRNVTYTSSSLSPDGTKWTFALQDGQSAKTLTLPNRFSKHLQILGRNGQEVLLRLVGAKSQVPLVTAPPAPAGSQAEGEPAAVTTSSVVRSTATSTVPSPAAIDRVHAQTPADAWRGAVDGLADLFNSRRRRDTAAHDLVLAQL